MYEVLVSHEADKYYKKQNRDTKRRINKCIDNLSVEPLFGPHKRLVLGTVTMYWRSKGWLNYFLYLGNYDIMVTLTEKGEPKNAGTGQV